MKICPMCIVAAGVLAVGGGFLLGGAGALPSAREAATEVSADAFAIDAVHSHVGFRIKHMNVSYSYGRFNDVSGTFSIDKASPEAAKIDISVNATSIDTANSKRDDHLRGADFFSVKEFEKLTFKSTGAKKGTGDVIDVTGDLTFHGVTKSVTVPVTHTGEAAGRGGGRVAGFETALVIKRSDYGMNFMPQVLGEDVTLIISIEGGTK